MTKPIIKLELARRPTRKEYALFLDALRDVTGSSLDLPMGTPVHVPVADVLTAFEWCLEAATFDRSGPSVGYFRETVTFLKAQEPDALITIEA